MSTGKLILAPLDPDSPAPPGEQVLDFLREAGLIGTALDPGQRTFLVGDGFLELVSFMGCSAHVELEPPASGGTDFCHVSLLGPFESARLFAGRNTTPPRCPRCGGRLSEWRTRTLGPQLSCERCGASLKPTQLNWRRSAGFARLAVQVHNVFPSEAVPVPGLMKGLARLGAGDWGYFYVQPDG